MIGHSATGIVAAWKEEPYAMFGEAACGEASRQAVIDMIEDLKTAWMR